MKFGFVIAVLAICATLRALCQTVPDATEKSIGLTAGAGFSDYNGDFPNGRLKGGALWINCLPCGLHVLPKGFGLELEARGIRKTQASTNTYGTFQQGEFGGGFTYSYLRYPRIHPYLKVLAEYAGIDFNINVPRFHHLSQVMYAPGGGLDYRVDRHLVLRADYEYQIWPDLFKGSTFTLDPQGITVGAMWEFRATH